MATIIFHFILIACIAWFGSKRVANGLGKKWFWIGIGMRFCGAAAFALIYVVWIGTGDTIHFFSHGSDLASLAKTDFSSYLDYIFSSQHDMYKSDRRDGFFIKIVSFFCLATNNNYWITTTYFALISFFSSWYFVGNLYKVSTQKYALIFAFLIFPTPIFWTSGLMKDTIVWSAIVVAIGSILKIKQRPGGITIGTIFLISLALFLLFELRYFLFGATLGLIIITLVDQFIGKRQLSKPQKWTIWLSLFLLVLTSISLLNPNLYLHNFPQALFDNYEQIIQNSESGKFLVFDLKPTWVSIFKNLPTSLLSGLFRPFPGEGGWFYLLHGLENILTLATTIYSVLKIRSISAPGTTALAALFFILVLASLTPLASPNFGTLMRYKAAYLPFLAYFATFIPFKTLFPNQSIKG
ncbi:MAG: hypothetical protein ABJG41_05485 [Cyclobacteriaceae bacterium]